MYVHFYILVIKVRLLSKWLWKFTFSAAGMFQEVEYLANKCKVLNSNLSTTKKKFVFSAGYDTIF
jgi:hypothetical protein